MTTSAKSTRAAEPELPEVSINVPLPAELHRQLRIRAATDGVSLKESVIAAIEAWVDE
jgi:predicted HicB family RNase H-like nuclease